MALIEIKNLTFAYDGSPDYVFENASVQLDTDWKLGFTGRNGRGKTTLMRLLTGAYSYKGTIAAPVEFDYFPFTVNDKTQLTTELAEELAPQAESWRFRKELFQLGLDDEILYRPFDTLSNGEQTKVLLALLFLKEHRFLLIDEPTNHLDLMGRRIVADYLNQKKGFILVSHDRAFLDRCTDHILAIQNTGLSVERGNFSSWYANVERKNAFELGEHEKLIKEISRLQEAAGQASRWSDQTESGKFATRDSGLRPDRGFVGHKAAKMMKRSKAIAARRETALEQKAGLLKDLERQEPLKLSPLMFDTQTLVSGSGLRLFYGDKMVCGPLDFCVCRGDRVAVTGANGSGKSTLLKLAAGEPISSTGLLEQPRRLLVSYVGQDTSGLKGDLRGYCEAMGIEESLFKSILRKMDFSREQFEKPMELFSQGQRKKAAIAASMCKQAHLYVWDEPLNFIDVLSRMQIETLLLEYCPTILFVEHDEAFVRSVATKELKLTE